MIILKVAPRRKMGRFIGTGYLEATKAVLEICMKVISYPGVRVQENALSYVSFWSQSFLAYDGLRGRINKGMREPGGCKNSQASPMVVFLQVWSLDD